MTSSHLLKAAMADFSEEDIYMMSEDEAYEEFCRLRFEGSAGRPVCPHCGERHIYKLNCRRAFKCAGCRRQFSATSGTIFADRKLPFKRILLAIVLFAMPSRGINIIQLRAKLRINYKSAFVLTHKLREYMRVENDAVTFTDKAVAVDGTEWGGFIRPANVRKSADGKKNHWKFPYRHSEKVRRAICIKEKGANGKVRFFPGNEKEIGRQVVYENVPAETELHTDQGSWWNPLAAEYDHRSINHTVQFSSPDACTNAAESGFSRLKKPWSGISFDLKGALAFIHL